MSERYCEHNRERDSCGNNNCPYCKVESLQKELEEVKELLGQWLAGEESVSCKCRLCNDTRKLLKGR